MGDEVDLGKKAESILRKVYNFPNLQEFPTFLALTKVFLFHPPKDTHEGMKVAVEHRCSEVYKARESKCNGRDTGWVETKQTWARRKYHEKFDEIYFEGIKYRTALERLGLGEYCEGKSVNHSGLSDEEIVLRDVLEFHDEEVRPFSLKVLIHMLSDAPRKVSIEGELGEIIKMYYVDLQTELTGIDHNSIRAQFLHLGGEVPTEIFY